MYYLLQFCAHSVFCTELIVTFMVKLKAAMQLINMYTNYILSMNIHLFHSKSKTYRTIHMLCIKYL